LYEKYHETVEKQRRFFSKITSSKNRTERHKRTAGFFYELKKESGEKFVEAIENIELRHKKSSHFNRFTFQDQPSVWKQKIKMGRVLNE